MIQVSNDFITALNQPTRQWRARLLYNGTDTGATTKAINVKGGSMTESTFNICGCYSMSVEAVIDTSNFVYENKEIETQLGLVLADESVEWITLGHFTITEVKRGKYTTTLIGAGGLSTKGGLEFSAPSTQTVANIISSVQTTTGKTIGIDSSFSTATVIEKPMENLTCLEVLNIVASVLGGFVTDKADGTIYIGKYPSVSTYSVGADRMTTEPTFSDYNTQITGVKVVVSEASVDTDGTPIPAVEYQTQDYNLVLMNPYMTQTAFTNFASALTGLSWRVGTVPIALGDPRIEATDLATVTVEGESFSVPCHNFIHSFDGGLTTTITSLGDSESLSESQQTGNVARQLKEIQADIVVAKKIEAEVVEIGGHFFVGQDGHVHITEEANNYTTGKNVLIDSDSVDIRNGVNTLATFYAEDNWGYFSVFNATGENSIFTAGGFRSPNESYSVLSSDQEAVHTTYDTIHVAGFNQVTLKERIGMLTDDGENYYAANDSSKVIALHTATGGEKQFRFNSDGTMTFHTNTKLNMGGTNPSTTQEVTFWGNSGNKIGIAVTNTADNKQFGLQVRGGSIRFYNYTDARTEYTLYPVLTKTVTGTTNTRGNLNLSLDGADYTVLSVIPASGKWAIPFIYTTSGGALQCWARILSDSATFSPVVSSSETVTVYYQQK